MRVTAWDKQRGEERNVRYLLMIYEDEDAWKAASAAQRDAVYAGHRDLMEALATAGKDVRGAELEPSTTAVSLRGGSGADRLRVDGPFTAQPEMLTGYYAIACDDVDEAVDWASRIPTIAGGVEVRPIVAA